MIAKRRRAEKEVDLVSLGSDDDDDDDGDGDGDDGVDNNEAMGGMHGQKTKKPAADRWNLARLKTATLRTPVPSSRSFFASAAAAAAGGGARARTNQKPAT